MRTAAENLRRATEHPETCRCQWCCELRGRVRRHLLDTLDAEIDKGRRMRIGQASLFEDDDA